MLKVVIIGYGTMFTNLIAATMDANCQVVGVLRKRNYKISPYYKKNQRYFLSITWIQLFKKL